MQPAEDGHDDVTTFSSTHLFRSRPLGDGLVDPLMRTLVVEIGDVLPENARQMAFVQDEQVV